jgi:hypothetical protein
MRKSARRLLSVKAMVGYAILILVFLNNFIGTMANVDFVLTATGNSRLVLIWKFLASPNGNLLAIAAVGIWLTVLILWPEKADKGSIVSEGSNGKIDKPQEYLDPVLELMHFGFDDVGKNERGAYVRVGKDFAGEVLKAAILDFRLKPVRDAVPWVEAQAHILFKDRDNQKTRVGAGIWQGRDQPKVPIRPGETQSLILTGGYSVSDQTDHLSTYEHGPSGAEDQRIERPLHGDNIRVCVGIISEYMSVSRSDNAWYFQIYKMGHNPFICRIKPTAFDKTLRLSKRRTSM